jgi:class 3 adenylate cyclase
MTDLALQYLERAWVTILFFAVPPQPIVLGGAAVVILFFLLLRVYIGGFFGWLLRYVAYGGLYWGLITRPGFRAKFAPAPPFEYKIGLVPAAKKMAAAVQSGQYQLTAYIVAAIFVVGLWLFVAIIGGIWRARRRRARGGGYAAAAAAAPADAASGGGQAFNVTLRESEKKQTMVIMMTDIKGYSARMEKDEAATFALLKEHNVIMRSAITTNRGREIKTIGDAFMVVFNSPIDGLRCGMAMQKGLYAFNKPRAAGDHLLVRIGIHQGEVIMTPKDVFGEGVNIAARMESITDPGGISISKDIYEAVKGKIEAGYQSVGTPKMKNIANPPEVFKVHVQY